MDSKSRNTVELPLSVPRRDPVPPQASHLSTSQNMSKQPVKRDSKFTFIVYGVLVLAILMGGYVLFTENLFTFTHAVVPMSASETMTTLYAYPLIIKADAIDKSTIDLFVANDESLPVPNKQVIASSSVGTLSPTNAMTDKMGHVSYVLTMDVPAVATIRFTIDGVLLDKQITVLGE